MILGINGIRLVAKRSGVGRAIEAIIRCLGELDHPFHEIRVYTPKPLDDSVYLPPIAKNVVLPSRLPNSLWEQFVLMRAHRGQDLLLCPSYVIPLFSTCPTFLIHHGSYEGFPRAFSWWKLNKARAIYTLSAKRATAVSTVSEYSKRDMVRFYKMQPDSIQVVPEGVDTERFRPIHDQQKLSLWRRGVFGADEHFIVYVGKPTERRNLSPLLRAYAQLKREGKISQKLLIVGADLPGTSPFRQVIADENIENDVVVKGYVGHEEMPLVYNAADLFVYPSSYEGFGMPVLEAMACGAPLIALNNTALPEFTCVVEHLLNDERVETIKAGIESVL
jgi:glycosyltransferase involved in cell wall biosynthesis